MAPAGTTIGAATQLSAQFNVVDGATGGARAVALPAGTTGGTCIVRHTAIAVDLLIFPKNGDSASINGASANAAFTLFGATGGTQQEFIASDATHWYSN